MPALACKKSTAIFTQLSYSASISEMLQTGTGLTSIQTLTIGTVLGITTPNFRKPGPGSLWVPSNTLRVFHDPISPSIFRFHCQDLTLHPFNSVKASGREHFPVLYRTARAAGPERGAHLDLSRAAADTASMGAVPARGAGKGIRT